MILLFMIYGDPPDSPLKSFMREHKGAMKQVPMLLRYLHPTS